MLRTRAAAFRALAGCVLALALVPSTASIGRTEPAPPAADSPSPAWVPFGLPIAQARSRPSIGVGPLEGLVEDLFAQLVAAVAEIPGNYFTISIADLDDPSGAIAAKGHLRNLLVLRLIETGRFKIVDSKEAGGKGQSPGGAAGSDWAPPDLALAAAVDRSIRWVSLSGLLSFPGKGGSDRVLLSAVDRTPEVDALLAGGAVRSMGRGFEVERVGTAGDEVLDAAAADVEGKGRDDLVLLSPNGITVLGLSGGREAVPRNLGFPELPRVVRAPRGLRGAVTALAPSGKRPGRILAATSALQLPAAWNPTSAQAGAALFEGAFPLAPGLSPGTVLVGRLVAGRNTFAATLLSAEPSSQSRGPSLALPFPFFSLERGRGAAAEGIGVVDTEWTLHLLTGSLGREVGRIEQCGVAFAVLDLLDDGSWEVVTTSPAVPGSTEKISIHRVSKSGASLVWQAEGVSGPVCAMASGDFSGDGRNEAVAVECGSRPRIFLVRRHAPGAP